MIVYSDFYVYDINSDTVMELSRDIALQGGPSPLNIVKAVLDHDRDEIYLISGTTRQSTLENPETLKNGKEYFYKINNKLKNVGFIVLIVFHGTFYIFRRRNRVQHILLPIRK